LIAAALAAIGVTQRSLPGYLQALCWLLGLSATALAATVGDKAKKAGQLTAVSNAALWIGCVLGLIAVLTVAAVIEHLTS
jgi:hypothetical protein